MFHNSLLGLLALCTLFGHLPLTSAGSHGSPTGAQLARRHARSTRLLQPRSSKSDLKPRDEGYQKQQSKGLNLYGIDPSALKLYSGLFVGFFPDDTKGWDGKQQTMADIIKSLDPSGHKKPALYNWYSQVEQGVPYDGKQLLYRLEDVKASGAVFVASVMVKGSWDGLKPYDNHQAVAIVKVLKQFTEQGIVVWLRPFHEANWYQHTQEYPGGPEDFKAGFHAMTQAVKDHAPEVKMFWCPNVAHDSDIRPNLKEYQIYRPWNMDDVHIVGIDLYSKGRTSAQQFYKMVQPFYDEYVKDHEDRVFVLGETGLHDNGGMGDKLYWLEQLNQAKSMLPKFLALSWYNDKKERDYQIVGQGVTTKAVRDKFE